MASIEELLEGRIGPPFTDEEFATAVKEGEQRFKHQVPPGYRDGGKDGDAKYGDWIIWKQVLMKASEQQRPVILVTDDAKDDWWWKSHGKILGPNPTLVAEMQRTANVRFYLYRTERFLQFANEYLNSQVEDDAIEEIREVRDATPQSEAATIPAALTEQRQLAAMMRPILEEQKQYEAIIRPILEDQRRYEAMMRPIAEQQKQYEAMMRPLLEQQKQFEAVIQPFLEEQRRTEALLRPAVSELKRHEAMARSIIEKQQGKELRAVDLTQRPDLTEVESEQDTSDAPTARRDPLQ